VDPPTTPDQPRGVGTFSWPPPGTATWPLTIPISSYRRVADVAGTLISAVDSRRGEGS
jgi:hypothetical protein